jgi:NADH dehydrogenase (ubiquinone) 1 alpha subcomplex subunit 9
MLYDERTVGQTFELYGPKEYTMAEIAALVDKEIFKKRRHFNVPKVVYKPVADLLNRLLWWHTTSGDEVEREFMDQVIDPTAKTFKDLDIEPGDIANFTYHYLVSQTLRCVGLRGLMISAARIPQLQLLRPTAGNGKGEAGGEEVHPRFG